MGRERSCREKIRRPSDTHLHLGVVQRHWLAEDDGWSRRHPHGEVGQDGREDGPSVLLPSDAVGGRDSCVSSSFSMA